MQRVFVFSKWPESLLSIVQFQSNEHEDGVQIIPRLEYCRSNHMTIFVSCIYVYKGLLMVMILCISIFFKCMRLLLTS